MAGHGPIENSQDRAFKPSQFFFRCNLQVDCHTKTPGGEFPYFRRTLFRFMQFGFLKGRQKAFKTLGKTTTQNGERYESVLLRKVDVFLQHNCLAKCQLKSSAKHFEKKSMKSTENYKRYRKTFRKTSHPQNRHYRSTNMPYFSLSCYGP